MWPRRYFTKSYWAERFFPSGSDTTPAQTRTARGRGVLLGVVTAQGVAPKPARTRVSRGRGALAGVLGVPTAGSSGAVTGQIAQSLPAFTQAATGVKAGLPSGNWASPKPRPAAIVGAVRQTLPGFRQSARGTVRLSQARIEDAWLAELIEV